MPDHVLSEHSTPELEIRAASVRGLLHRYLGKPRQDGFSVVRDPLSGTVVVVVCDGVGSLPRSQEAAAFVVDRLPAHYLSTRDWEKAVGMVNAELAAFVEQVHAGLSPDERTDQGMATTVVAVAITPGQGGLQVDFVRSDDSTAWVLSGASTWSELAGDAEAEGALHTGSVRALPTGEPKLRLTQTVLDGGALFVMTDGVDGPLRGSAEVRAELAEWWCAPPPIFDFGSQVGFGRKGHLDDRTVVGLWVRAGEGAEP
ncbi:MULTISPECIES: protein phosphatase 2C domain-containing protein [unclassified Amycolatopsis]|uniref:protein phosphatase 2C domain-containing protein n=1 Tax=unclassified Amycolatopsis TaxID=2618356 RepID=UPI0028753944|nr:MULTISPECIES: protein phosphatase 2C domain-containing protein [unclassified Amycolatopsis]MDS0132734.1 protein phosphatase 2C domain-containing protein [Amycolatopsis sp. 505]MDS0142441.1 protein phosphatase 2C domain-containing protein [Amycolatopsis sp. CM201R]